jgi:hypothetical protein
MNGVEEICDHLKPFNAASVGNLFIARIDNQIVYHAARFIKHTTVKCLALCF